MRVPLSWLSTYVDLGARSPEEVADLLTLGGLDVEGVLRPTGGTRGVVVAEVRAVAPVPGSEKLSLVEAYDGTTSHEIVCGASNFAVGDRVPAALPGATLPGPDPTRPVSIGRKALMGVTSHGMLASARELHVGDGAGWASDGIWLLGPDAPLGADVAAWLDLDDAVLDIDVTPDRGYALSVLGVARDVAALTGAPLLLPDRTAPRSGAATAAAVSIADPSRCHRFTLTEVGPVAVRPSPPWLQRRLAACGMRPISNVVDATNHALLDVGHPAHAYDADRVAGDRLVVRDGRHGERLVTLDGVERHLHDGDLAIADADGPVGLAGLMGGERTEVHDGTTRLLVEVASFDAAAVLRTSRRHGLRTEASARFEKTVPDATVGDGVAAVTALLVEVAGGSVADPVDSYPAPRPRPAIRLRPARADAVLGLDVGAATQTELLVRIGCTAEADGDDVAVTPPAHRPDLVIEEDLYEEVARLHGYERVPERLPSTGRVGRRQPSHDAERAVRRALAGGGWTEVLAFPFVADDDLVRLGLDPGDPRRRTVALRNPLSQTEAVLRTSLLPGLLGIVRRNANRQQGDLAVFEVGHVFRPPTTAEPGAPGGERGSTDGPLLPAEPTLLGLAAAGAFERPRHDRPARAADLADLLGAVDLVRCSLGLAALEVSPTGERPYHPGRAARLSRSGVDLGAVGELHPRVIAAYGLPARTLAGELRLDRLTEAGVVVASGVREPSPLPSLRLDVAAVVDEAVPAAVVARAVAGAAGERLTGCELFDVFRGPSIGEGRKSLAYRLRLDDPSRPLTDADQRAVIDAVDAALRAFGGALRR